jgi:RNA polymerase sigma-70 factor (ECF subfamily)
VYILTAQLAEFTLGLATNNLTADLHRASQRLRAELTQSCRVCSKHGCLDCTCDPADSNSAHRHAAAAKQ